ncbi:MAG: hypothetical protein RIS84_1079 [Pseudomonadota bacterium]|jgi:nitrous oxidase accessory protein
MPHFIAQITLWTSLSCASLVAWGETAQILTETKILQDLIDAAPAGSVLELPAAHYRGNLVIKKPITLRGKAGTVFDGAGAGHVVLITAPHVTLQNIFIENSGINLTTMDAGIFVAQGASHVSIEQCSIRNVAFGIWLDSSQDAKILKNQITGYPHLRSQDRGNGIHLFNVNHAEVVANHVWETRDGIYIDTSTKSSLRDNELHDLRYGIHYMFTQESQVIGNYTHHTRTGYALMQSQKLTVRNNRSDADQNYGILLNYITHSEISGNRITNVERGRSPMGNDSMVHGAAIQGAEGKALFVYNALYNRLTDNLLSGSEIGIHLTAGSEENLMYNNAFINNQTQVKYVATRPQEWSKDKRGNYWSDYLGWDRNADGVGDVAYEPNDAIDKLLWRYPSARLLMHSPAVEMLRWVQREFPVLRPQGVKDSYPLMHAPAW